MKINLPIAVYAGQQVRILGENYTLDDEEDSKIGQVMHHKGWVPLLGGVVKYCCQGCGHVSFLGVWSSMCIHVGKALYIFWGVQHN